MKILHVSQVLHAGVGSMIEEIVPHQIARWGAENVALVVPENELALGSPIRQARLFTFPSSRRSAWGLLDAWRALRTARTMFSPDIEHLHSTFAGVLGRFNGGGRALQVYCPHGWAFTRDFDDRSGRAAARAAVLVERRLARATDATVMVSTSERAAAHAHGIRSRSDTLILNSIADRPLMPRVRTAADQLEIVFVGRLVRQKAPEIALDMMRTLPPGTAHLTLIGAAADGSTPPGTDNVTCLGWIPREEVQSRLAAADVLVLPSRWEGLPMSALEAFRAGTAVLISAAANAPELVRNDVEGRVVEELSAQAFRDALLATPPDAWRTFGEQARRSYEERFTSRRMNAELDALYETLLLRRSR